MKYSSVAWIGFTVYHDTEHPYESVTVKELRKRLLLRIADVDEADDWNEAIGFADTAEDPQWSIT